MGPSNGQYVALEVYIAFLLNFIMIIESDNYDVSYLGNSGVIKNVFLIEKQENYAFYIDNIFKNYDLIRSLKDTIVCATETAHI